MGISTADKVIDIAMQYLGCGQNSDKMRYLIDTFNKVKPHGEVAHYSDPWCAEAWTAWQILAGNTQADVPMSYNVGTLIRDAKALGIWVENDAAVPGKGWGIIYDWDDSGKGDDTTGADHVGLVYAVDAKWIYVIEGNKGKEAICGKRAIQINGRFIRGFIAPKYAGSNPQPKPTPTPAPAPKPSKPTYKVGKDYKLQDNMRVRTGPGTNYSVKKRSQLTKDGQAHSVPGTWAVLKTGTEVTCLEVKNNWMRIPSGWVCCYEGNEIYIK